MIRRKSALISSAIILSICMYLYFPFPNNLMLDSRVTFMSFPIRNQDGYIVLGIIGSFLFVIAMVLLVLGLKKYHFQTVIIVAIAYVLLPLELITLYQETFASGISAISYDGKGECTFDAVNENLLSGECKFILQNHSNEAVSLNLELLDSYFLDDETRMESLMNISGPYSIIIEANEKKSIHLNELLDVTNVPKHIEGGTLHNVHFKLIDSESERTL